MDTVSYLTINDETRIIADSDARTNIDNLISETETLQETTGTHSTELLTHSKKIEDNYNSIATAQTDIGNLDTRLLLVEDKMINGVDKMSTSAGSTVNPIYFKDGRPAACDYFLNKDVPADAKFTDTTYSCVSAKSEEKEENAGLMSVTDKIKLDDIEEKANHYIHPQGSGYNHIPAGGKSGQILQWNSAGEAKWANAENASFTLTKATTTSLGGFLAGGAGLKLSEEGVLSHRSDAGWKHIPSGGQANRILRYSGSGTAIWGDASVLLYQDSNNTDRSVTLNEPVSNFNYLAVKIRSANSTTKSWFLVSAVSGEESCFEAHSVTDGTMWVNYGIIHVGDNTLYVQIQVNIPLTAYTPGQGNNTEDCRIIEVRGLR